MVLVSQLFGVLCVFGFGVSIIVFGLIYLITQSSRMALGKGLAWDE